MRTLTREVKEVLTGFKYIGETIDKLTANEEYVSGMEESYGYLVGTHATKTPFRRQ